MYVLDGGAELVTEVALFLIKLNKMVHRYCLLVIVTLYSIFHF